MSYNFKEIEKKVYPKTFLKDVHLRMDFENGQSVNSNFEGFFKKNFGLAIDTMSQFKGMAVNSDDGLIKFDFSLSHVELTLRHPAYKQFNFALQWVGVITDYLHLMGSKAVNKLTISKYNELGFSLPKGVGVELVMQQVFSESMLSYGKDPRGMLLSDKDSFESTSRWEKFGSFKGDDDLNSLFSFEFGFSRRATEPANGCLTLKTIIESRDVVIEIDTLRNVMCEFNDILDRGFHWCVNEGIIKKMEEQ